jgi:hypothetical protein
VAIAAATADAVLATATGAGVDRGTQLPGTAGRDGSQDLAVATGHGLAEALEIRVAVQADDLGKGGHNRGAPAKLRGARLLHPLLDGGDGVLLTMGSQVQVEGGGLERAVPQVLLDQAQVDTGLEQVGGVAVPQRVQGDALLEAEIAHHAAQCTLHAVLGHRVLRGAGLLLVAADGREEPAGMPMRGPVVAQHAQRALGQRYVAVPRALAAVDVDQLAGAVEVADLEEEAFGEPQAERVHGPEIGAIVARADRVDQAAHLLHSEHIGERLRPRDLQALEGGPLARHGMAIEELDAVEGKAERRGGRGASRS